MIMPDALFTILVLVGVLLVTRPTAKGFVSCGKFNFNY